jgi:hypothetical protein
MEDYSDLNSKPGQASFLPQYFHSPCMYERFLNATNNDVGEIERAINSSGIKLVDLDEQYSDNLNYFISNKQQLEDEFYSELSTRIGDKKTNEFCTIIRESWFDGRTERESKPVKELFASIKNYLLEYGLVTKTDDIRVINDIDDKIKPSFDDDEIETIIELNRQMLDGHIGRWLKGHPNDLEMGTGDIYCRRGIFEEKEFEEGIEYWEWNYINSYSLAFTVTEKFSQMANKGRVQPAIINTNIANIRERVLFFSPFIKGMPPQQFELGVIPHWVTMKISKQGNHGGINEYIVDW